MKQALRLFVVLLFGTALVVPFMVVGADSAAPRSTQKVTTVVKTWRSKLLCGPYQAGNPVCEDTNDGFSVEGPTSVMIWAYNDGPNDKGDETVAVSVNGVPDGTLSAGGSRVYDVADNQTTEFWFDHSMFPQGSMRVEATWTEEEQTPTPEITPPTPATETPPVETPTPTTPATETPPVETPTPTTPATETPPVETPTPTPTETSTPPPKTRLDACTHFNLQVADEKSRVGTYRMYNITGGFLTEWDSVGNEDGSDIRCFDITAEAIWVIVVFFPNNGENPIPMHIWNHAPGLPWGWIARGQNHAVDFGFGRPTSWQSGWDELLLQQTEFVLNQQQR